jgi:hypothetical protein
MRFLDHRAARDQHLRSLEREVNRLRQAQDNAPLVPLEHPYQRGWVKTYVLREDVWRRPDTDVFRAVLKLINRRVRARRPTFTTLDGDPITLEPKIIPVARWTALALPAAQQRFFGLGHWPFEYRDDFLVEFRSRWKFGRRKEYVVGYKLQSTWWLAEEIQPHLITHQRVELPWVHRRLAEIEAHMSATCGWERLRRLHGHRQWWFDLGPDAPRNQRAALTCVEELGSG